MLNVTDQYCISPPTSKGGFSCHLGDLSKVSFMSRVMQVRKARHKASFLALQDSQKHSFLALGCGGCALTFAGIMFFCIWFSQLYMLLFNKQPLLWPKYPIMGL